MGNSVVDFTSFRFLEKKKMSVCPGLLQKRWRVGFIPFFPQGMNIGKCLLISVNGGGGGGEKKKILKKIFLKFFLLVFGF
ncbi:hypothetical protein D7D25_14065 [Proteiniphilum sp. X52]|nr:hypothetical protein D7D25_14065 [Proteiniphilum sp. X52]